VLHITLNYSIMSFTTTTESLQLWFGAGDGWGQGFAQW